MRIIDGFLYNGEFDILKLRLESTSNLVDEFVIIESKTTFTGLNKKSLLRDHFSDLKNYIDKISYYIIEDLSSYESAWEKEYFLRQSILDNINAKDDDIIIISDVDEILNLEFLLPKISVDKINLIEIPCFYNYLNLMSSENFYVSLISKYKSIKNLFIGNRGIFSEFDHEMIYNTHFKNGGHFTYQFGTDIQKYIRKIQSFSHQEFNKPYYLNEKRLTKRIELNIDIYDRWSFKYTTINLESFFPSLYKSILNNNLEKTLIKKENKFIELKKYSYLLTNKTYLNYLFYLIRCKLSKIKNSIKLKMERTS